MTIHTYWPRRSKLSNTERRLKGSNSDDTFADTKIVVGWLIFSFPVARARRTVTGERRLLGNIERVRAGIIFGGGDGLFRRIFRDCGRSRRVVRKIVTYDRENGLETLQTVVCTNAIRVKNERLIIMFVVSARSIFREKKKNDYSRARLLLQRLREKRVKLLGDDVKRKKKTNYSRNVKTSSADNDRSIRKRITDAKYVNKERVLREKAENCRQTRTRRTYGGGNFVYDFERDRENVPFEIRSDRLFTGEHRVTVVLVPASFVAENSSGRFYIRRAPWNPRHGFPTAIKFDSKCVWPFSAFKFRTLRIVRRRYRSNVTRTSALLGPNIFLKI